MAVLGAVALAGDVNPVDAAVGGFFDELVKVAMVHDPCEPSVEDVGVGETLSLPVGQAMHGDMDVAGFSGHVLGVFRTTHLDVEQGAAVAGADNDPLLPLMRGSAGIDEGTEGFENLFAQLLEGWDILRWYMVVDAKLGGGG